MKSILCRILIASWLVSGAISSVYSQTVLGDNSSELNWVNIKENYQLSDFKGHVVLLCFWRFEDFHWSAEYEVLNQFKSKFPELIVVGVHCPKFTYESTAAYLDDAIDYHNIDIPIINDSDYNLSRSFAIPVLPTYILIDPEGRKVGTYPGPFNAKGMESLITPLLEEYKFRKLLKDDDFLVELLKHDKAMISYPSQITIDPENENLFISISNENCIAITTLAGKILKIIGSGKAGSKDGPFSEARFNNPNGLAFDKDKNLLYVADTDNHLIRKIDIKNNSVETILGTGIPNFSNDKNFGIGTEVAIAYPFDLTIIENELFITMSGKNQIWKMDIERLQTEVLLGDGITNRLDGFLIQSQLARPLGICSNKKDLYFVEGESSSLRQSKAGFVSTLIGINMIEFGDVDGKFPHAMMQYPTGIFFDNNKIYIADTYNQKIKSFDLQTEELKTLISNTTDKVILNCPNDLIIHNRKVYVINKFNNKIVVYDMNSRETTWWELELPN